MYSDRLPAGIAATAIGVYLVVVAGATIASSAIPAWCHAWPACGSGWALPVTVAGWIALAHRLGAVLVGLALFSIVLSVWGRSVDWQTKVAIGVAGVLYPIQAGLGAILVISPTGNFLASLHLVVGIGIFGCLLASLAWQLNSTAPRDAHPDAESPVASHTEPTVRDATADPTQSPHWLETVQAYLRLTKPRLMWLLCLVAVASIALAAGTALPLRTTGLTVIGGILAIGASGTFNHVFERDIDRQMKRTADRPLPVDQISVRNAVVFGVVLTAGALVTFLAINRLVAVLGLVAIMFYSVGYTLILKPNTVYNTVIGGAAGALPALIGWAAATGRIGIGGLLLAGIIFTWTPAHFYNLALAYKDDYAAGGFPMLPVVKGDQVTRRRIIVYFGATLSLAAVLAVVTELGWLYVLAGTSTGAVFLAAIVQLHHDHSPRAALRSFHASNAYLGSLLLAIIIDASVL